jgi:hypothetical protein
VNVAQREAHLSNVRIVSGKLVQLYWAFTSLIKVANLDSLQTTVDLP